LGKLSNAKILGGIGAILGLVGLFIPTIGFVLPIVGLILVFIAVKYISEETNDDSIFRNYLFYFIFSVIAVISLFAIIPLVIGVSLFNFTDPSYFTDPTMLMESLGTVIAACILSFIIAYIFYIISAIYLKKSYASIAQHTNVDLFKTTGLIYLIGAATIIIGVGIFIILIARIIEIISFFSLPDALPATTGAPAAQQQPPGRVCPNCGRPIPMDSQVCPYCGKDFRPPAPPQ